MSNPTQGDRRGTAPLRSSLLFGGIGVAVTALALMLGGGSVDGLPFNAPQSTAERPAASVKSARDLEQQIDPERHVRFISAYSVAHGAEIHPLLAPSQEPSLTELTLEVKSGDTLMGLLIGAGADNREAHQVVEALREVYSPRKIRPGQEIRLAFAEPTEEGDVGPDGQAGVRLVSFSLSPSVEQEVAVEREAGSFVARAIDRPLQTIDGGAGGEVTTSLFDAAARQGVPHAILVEAIRALSFDVDFQRDVQPGDYFEFLYERLIDEDENFARSGELLYAELVVRGKSIRLYRYTPESGVTDYFNSQGESVRRALLRTPVDGARMSSGYGMRKHPILGYSRMHRGVDFAAPTGTPIYAAGDGVVQRANRFGAYGNYVRIRHNSTYDTAYAHLSRFAEGIRPGTRVRQGQVIGYVGATGTATGPHLHYEVLVDGEQVNPAGIELPSGETLESAELDSFQRHVAEIDVRRAKVQTEIQLAAARCADSRAGNDCP